MNLPAPTGPTTRPDLELVVPCHDEEAYLEACVMRLLEELEVIGRPATITIVDSGSADRTWDLACRLAAEHGPVQALRVSEPGRGRALRAAWSRSSARVLGYTDVDLSADVGQLAAMWDAVDAGRADIAIASRLATGSQVERGLRREVLSRAYAELVQWVAAPPFRDLQCGFKVLDAATCQALLPSVHDDAWFFDTELLLGAWTTGRTVLEQPVRWRERRESRVRLLPTIASDVAGLARMTHRRWAGRRRPPWATSAGRCTLAHELGGLGSQVLVRHLGAPPPVVAGVGLTAGHLAGSPTLLLDALTAAATAASLAGPQRSRKRLAAVVVLRTLLAGARASSVGAWAPDA